MGNKITTFIFDKKENWPAHSIPQFASPTKRTASDEGKRFGHG
jgi:hypothetical protein